MGTEDLIEEFIFEEEEEDIFELEPWENDVGILQ
jgi:hypothetical protein